MSLRHCKNSMGVSLDPQVCTAELHTSVDMEPPGKRAITRESVVAAGFPSYVATSTTSFAETPPDPFVTRPHANVRPAKNVVHDNEEGTGWSIATMALCPVP